MAGRQVTRRPREVTPAVEEQTRQTSYGVEPGADVEDIAIMLRNNADDPTTPWCSCTSRKTGFGFDPQIGVYLHADPKCWRPSKAYYEAARQAGVLAPERGSSADQESGDRGHRESVQVPPGDGGDRTTSRRRPRRPAAAGQEDAEGSASRSREESGDHQTGGGDVLGERSNRAVRADEPPFRSGTRRVTRRRRDTTALWSDQY